jgi:glycosyltransferase involved in cell wall biosynthesis/spore maturation protein CgeB
VDELRQNEAQERGRSAAHDADLSVFRSRMAQIAFHLGLHETSIVRELGAAQVEALRSARGAFALPGRLWRLLGRIRRGHARVALTTGEVTRHAADAFAKYQAHGFVEADATVSAQFLTMQERARVYAELADRVLPLSGTDACRFGDIAVSFDHEPSLTLWLGMLKYDAGQVGPALEVLSRLPADFPVHAEGTARITSLRGFARLLSRRPSIPKLVQENPGSPEDGGVLLVFGIEEATAPHVVHRALRLARTIVEGGRRVTCAMPAGFPVQEFLEHTSGEGGDLTALSIVRLDTLDASAPIDAYMQRLEQRLIALTEAERPSVVHAIGNYRVAIPAVSMARRRGAGFVYERTGFTEFSGETRVADWRSSELFHLEQSLEALAYQHASTVMVGTQRQVDEVRRRMAGETVNVEQLPTSVESRGNVGQAEARMALGLPVDGRIIGHVDAGSPFDGLSDIAAAIERGLLHVDRLIVLSDGEISDHARQAVSVLPVSQVELLGHMDLVAMATHMQACSVLAFAWRATAQADLQVSAYLPFAMAHGVPVLASSCYAFGDLARDGTTARVFSAGNVESLARCMSDILDDPVMAARLGAAAADMVAREHAWPEYVRRIHDAYKVAGEKFEVGPRLDTARSAALVHGERLRVAAIMDEFTHSCFSMECDLVQLTIDDWQAQLAESRPDFLLVESAWQGFEGQWEKRVAQAGSELRKLLAHCRREGVRTVFWNKEDPVHFSLFLRAASLFDVVFTTDIDRIKAYKRELGHDRVYLLPFACQPRVHNPIERYARKDAFCFAGSYYEKYPERRRDFEQLVEAAEALRPVEIYDRNHGKQDPGLQFPERYRSLIQGTLPVAEIDRAYKGYRYAITVNTVKQSQSMFARRAFELLASNTLTISNFSRGQKLMLGDLVVSGGSAGSLRGALERRIATENDERRFRLIGLRKVMGEHTYAHRLAYMAHKVLGRPLVTQDASILIVCAVASQDHVDAAVRAFGVQVAGSKKLLLVVAQGFLPTLAPGSDIALITEQEAREIDPSVRWPDTLIGTFDARDHYGPHYLRDLQLAARYSDRPVLGKAAHYVATGDGPRLQDDGSQYRQHDMQWPLRRAVLGSRVLEGMSLHDVTRAGFSTMPLPGLAIAEFDYCEGGAGLDSATYVDSSLALDEGIPLPELLAVAEATAGESTEERTEDLPGFHGAALQALFAPAAHAEGMLKLTHSLRGILLESRLPPKQHAYAYASRMFRASELVRDGFVDFHLVTESGLYVNAVVVYLDAAKNKLSHAIVSSDTNQSLPVPPATTWIRFALRVLGSGETTVKALVRGAVSPAMDHLMGRGHALLVSKDYPRYDDLYRYGFVHRRVLGYAESGYKVDVFRFSNAPLSFDEFEGVDVVAGQVEHLRLLLQGNRYESVLVHAMDPLMWQAIKPLLETRRVVVWVHGAEMQPWYRRISNLGDGEAAREMARRASEKRTAMWKEVLTYPHPNLRVVFVSRHLEEEAMMDLGVRVPEQQRSVIPNFVDGNLFRHEPKPAALRNRILSIRPFASAVYANDLSVKAIQRLSSEPFFGELEFTIIGDGSLFDETVAPLLEYPNVRLERRFLSQTQIAELHRTHGIFLVPSRMDSQGVSRDEAMSSGLVPVTSRVAAIPEFVDASCAILAEPEDAAGLAEGIALLHRDPELFGRMSLAASERARRISGREATIEKELQLIRGKAPQRALFHASSPTPSMRIAVYGDVNLNITDGSAIWAASLAEVLAGAHGVEVTLYLKAKIVQTHVIAPLLSLRGLRIVEPSMVKALTPSAALDAIQADDDVQAYDSIVLRGLDLCDAAAQRNALRGRLWVYLTDVPQTPEEVTPEAEGRVSRIADAAGAVLCQTPQFQEYMEEWIPATQGKTRILPPMVPPAPTTMAARESHGLDVVYAGKFAPLWGIREMLDAVGTLRASGHVVTLHVYGDKIHNPADDTDFRPEIARRLAGDDGVIWHGAVERNRLLGELSSMDVGWAWRHDALEGTTHELSTKLLEYASARVPPIMARNAVNMSVFGEAYPLYANTPHEAVVLLARLAEDPALRAIAVEAAAAASKRFDFASVRDFLRSQGLLPTDGSGDAFQPHDSRMST